MRRVFIFANGRMDEPPEILKDISSSDLIITADGGTHHCKSLGIIPNVIIGDMDSLASSEVSSYQDAGVLIIQYPTHKDETDLELALQYTVRQGVRDVFIIGALGSRWDMTVANILLISHPDFSSLIIRLLDGSQELTLLRGYQEADIQGRSGSPISLIPLAGDAHGITTHGLEYPLNNETLSYGSSRGVSNVFLQDHARILVKDGLLLLCTLNSEVKYEGNEESDDP
jgi:thiamine pyrophosphokinase